MLVTLNDVYLMARWEAFYDQQWLRKMVSGRGSMKAINTGPTSRTPSAYMCHKYHSSNASQHLTFSIRSLVR
jgi:hypothetical protein